MKYILLIVTFAFLQACKKENKKSCYECDFYQNNSYKEVGCYTQKEWADTTFRTMDGRELEKSRCREK